MGGFLAHIDTLGVFGNQIENRLPYQPVIDYHFCGFNGFAPFDGQQLRISGACSDQNDLSLFHWYFLLISSASTAPTISPCSRGPEMVSK